MGVIMRQNPIQVLEELMTVGFRSLIKVKFAFLLITSTLTSPSLGYAEPLRDNSILEAEIWLKDVKELRDLESRAVRIVQQDPRSTYGHFLLAEIYLRRFKNSPSQLKLLQQASDLGQQIIELDPGSDLGYLIAAQVLDLMGYTENALSALEGDPKIAIRPSWRHPFIKGQLLSGQYRDKEVLRSFETSLSSPGVIADVVIPYLVATLQSQTSSSDAYDTLQYWRTRHPHKLLDLSLALYFSQKGKFSEAHELYKMIQKRDGLVLEAYVNDAILLDSNLNQPSEAIKLLKEILSHQDKFDKQRVRAVQAHLARILIAREPQRLDEARNLLRTVITESENPTEWLIFSHKAFLKSGKLHDFITLLADVRQIIPVTSFIYALEGEVLSEHLAKHDEAIESFRSAITLEPTRSEFYNGLGLAFYRKHDIAKALAVFQEATRIDPKDATSRYNEACVLAILGRQVEALGSLKAAFELDPKLQQAARTDADLKSLWSSEDFVNLTEPSLKRND